MNAADVNHCGLPGTPGRKEKAGLRCEQPGRVARSGEEKAGHVPASGPTVVPARKFQKKIDCDEKNSLGMAAMQLLHCTIVANHLYPGIVEDKLGA